MRKMREVEVKLENRVPRFGLKVVLREDNKRNLLCIGNVLDGFKTDIIAQVGNDCSYKGVSVENETFFCTVEDFLRLAKNNTLKITTVKMFLNKKSDLGLVSEILIGKLENGETMKGSLFNTRSFFRTDQYQDECIDIPVNMEFDKDSFIAFKIPTECFHFFEFVVFYEVCNGNEI